MAVLVDLQNVVVRRADRVLFEDLSLTVSDGDRIGVVGINGTGKSTLLRVIGGVDPPDGGQVRRGRGARVGFLDQRPDLPPGTVAEAVGEGWEARAALERLGMGAAAGTDVAELSGGQAKRVALARVLAQPAELLILDEPTNHLDLGAVSWLEHRLESFRGGLVLVTHDRHLLDRLTTRMVELDRGHVHLHDGGYAAYLEAGADRRAHAESAEATRRTLARRELAWLRRGAQARSRKPQARVEAAVRIIEDRPEAEARETRLDLAAITPRLGDKVVECHGVGFHYDGGPTVVRDVELVLSRRERLGIVGANGSGKSTLVDLMAGRRRPSAGRVEVGPTVVTGYYDQHGVELDPDARVDELVAGPHRTPGSLADVELMKRFWFAGALTRARVGTLSGGERRRLQLLVVMAARPNLLFLDEPTNDLDLDTLRILEDYLEEWPGALVVVSHDRTFLERTTSRLVAVESDGSVAEVAGGIGGWVARMAGPGPAGGTAPARGAAPAGGPVSAGGAAPVGGGASAGGGRPANLPGGPTAPPAGGPARKGSGDVGPKPAVSGRQLREAEKLVERLQRQRDRITEALAATTDHRELHRMGGELSEAQAALDRAEENWLTLAEQSESGR